MTAYDIYNQLNPQLTSSGYASFTGADVQHTYGVPYNVNPDIVLGYLFKAGTGYALILNGETTYPSPSQVPIPGVGYVMEVGKIEPTPGFEWLENFYKGGATRGNAVDIGYVFSEVGPNLFVAPYYPLPPALDPLLIPPLAPEVLPRPIPFRILPARKPNPDRAPTERPTPGTQPSNRPRPALNPLLRPATRQGLRPALRPDTAPAFQVFPPRGPVRPTHRFAPPRRREKERKAYLPAWLYPLMRGAFAATEAIDVLEALHKALPPGCQKGETPQAMALDIFRCFPDLDLEAAAGNLLENMIEDGIIGRSQGRSSGTTPGYPIKL
jgi:hypothetical protein